MKKEMKPKEITEKERLLFLKKHNLYISCHYGLINWYVVNEDNEIIESFNSKYGAKAHAAYLKRLTGLHCYWVISKEDYKEIVTPKKRKQRFK